MREAVEEAVSEVKNALTRLDEVYALYADPMRISINSRLNKRTLKPLFKHMMGII